MNTGVIVQAIKTLIIYRKDADICKWLHLVMGRTPFYRTSIELEHHFLNIERTQTSFFDH